ncbi:MAG: ChbG/HpnK family deacetylase [Candidatus Tectomicrobia bacterium]|nr:ChbG/HpnK family deacetylase [Candidatus Tectomicrobia bacterium]
MAEAERARFLIVNADDFGLAPAIDAGILAAYEQGIVSSTTLIVTLPGAEAAAAALRSLPDAEARSRSAPALPGMPLGVGLHLNLSLGKPLSPAAEVPSLVADDGRFSRDAEALLPSAAAEEIERELRMQMARFSRLLGRLPTHLDAHKHLDRFPAVREAMLRCASLHALPLRAALPATRAACRAAGVRHTTAFLGDYFLSGSEQPPAWTEAKLVHAILNLQSGWTELMCHPGRLAQDEAPPTSYSWQRVEELRGLCAPAVREALARAGVRLASYAGLALA